MTIRQTRTYAELGLSKAAYDEISRKLREADYRHAFMEDGTIDMHGIGVTCADVDRTSEHAFEATNEIMKVLADCSYAPYAHVKANVQAVIAKALRKCRTN